MKIIAVVPTFNRPHLLKKNLECLISQTRRLDLIVVVDNASDSTTFEMLKSCIFFNEDLFKYIRLDENIGASGGFATGMKVAVDEGAEWIWGMDDDAFPHSNALEKLMDANKSGNFDCLWSNVDNDHDWESPTKSVNRLMFVGFFVSKKLINVVGYPDVRFYMYDDDTDYSQRIISEGFKIIKVKSSIIEHKAYDQRGNNPKTEFCLLGVRFYILNCEPYRLYYIYRNRFFLKKNYWGKIIYLLKLILLNYPKYLIFKKKSSNALLLAAYHAIQNKRGKTLLPSNFF